MIKFTTRFFNKNIGSYQQYKAFTLAEVLITLGIIGVVAALTITTLMNKTNDIELRSGWKKQFSSISNATKLLSVDYNTFNGIFSDSNDFRDKILSKMNSIKKCDVGTSGCWAPTWYKLSGGEFTDYDITTWSRATLSDGSNYAFNLGDTNCNWGATIPGGNNCGQISIDVNGNKLPNKIGKDIFTTMISGDARVIAAGTQGDWSQSLSNACDTTSTFTIGWMCSAQYLYDK